MPLPEPTNYFTIKEICNRWGCGIEYLLTSNFNELLAIVVYIKSALYSDIDFRNFPYNIRNIYHDTKHLVKGYYFINEDINNLSRGPLFIHELCSSYKSKDIHYLKIPLSIKLSNLRISRSERDRFEKEFNIEIKSPPHYSDSSNTTVSHSRQKNRENALKEYLEKNNLYDEITTTHEDLWSKLSEDNKKLFGPTSKATIKKFFNKQKLCSFKLGRK